MIDNQSVGCNGLSIMKLQPIPNPTGNLTYLLCGAEMYGYSAEEVEARDGREQIHDQVVVRHVLGVELQALQVVLGELTVQLHLAQSCRGKHHSSKHY